MPTTFTSKNIPDPVHQHLKAAAELHLRSMNSEAIVSLEAVLLPAPMAPAERLPRAREIKAALKPGSFLARGIDALKREGRA